MTVVVRVVLMYFLVNNIALDCVERPFLTSMLVAVMIYAADNVNWRREFRMPSRRTCSDVHIPEMVKKGVERTESTISGVSTVSSLCA